MIRDDELVRYWIEWHVAPGRLGENERYTLLHASRILGDIRCEDLRSRHLAEYRDERMQHVADDTVRREMRAIRRALKIARDEMDAPIPNVRDLFDRVRLPESAPPRERRLSAEEEAALFAAASRRMQLAMTVAIETGMRRREMCSVTHAMVDLDAKVIRLPREATKTKRGRTVPLSPRAAAAVEEAIDLHPDHSVVMGYTTNALNQSWRRTRERASHRAPSVKTFRWHDFRHECISRLAEKGWQILEIQAVSGHSTPAMLSRYCNLRAEDLVAKLGGGNHATPSEGDPRGQESHAG